MTTTERFPPNPITDAFGNVLTGGNYVTVAASQTDQVMGTTGQVSDCIAGVLVLPATTSPGVVSIRDGSSGSSITIFPGGASSVLDLKPFPIPLGAISNNAGGWRVTTGANVSAIVFGRFTT